MNENKLRFVEGALMFETVDEYSDDRRKEGVELQKDCFIEVKMGREQDGWNLDKYIDSEHFAEDCGFEIVDGKISLEDLKTILKSIVVIDQSVLYDGRTDTVI